MKPSAPAPVATVDEQNPWLGLVSFTEETRGYFHGREEEAAELSRRVQRKLLTILFGQSGLGKTSILQAGLVPRLRPEGFCPVYVRLDYSPDSPSPSEQIKRAVFKATEAAGTWTQVGSSATGETLWEFLHHRDDVLKDANGRTLIPILIFDQFEEIFTLAQSDDAGRKRAQEFLADLADLVENRPPASLEARIDRDEADAGRFDFARADYRILISLREDYLAHLEGLKGQMPSVTQNRMRLARMTGPQAVAAVCAPAPHLVTETVAEAIVRFVAGGADLARAEVEPSLLSLICRELNNTRLAKGHAEISADLLAGSRDTILSEFYERALADQPAGVRVFIEDEMLTDSGFRESVAEERVRKAFVAAGATPDALAVLVNRRLLRVEDRLDLRRVEITHDVLCSVVAASRGVRREREALEESQRQLAAQREREEATRRSLVRARAVAAISAALMLVAAGSAVFGWINLRRAREAEVQTQAARQLAENARAQSEKLVGFLLDEFYEELQPTGRVEIIKTLADRAVAYYEGLPPNLVTPQTKLYHGMALIRKAAAMGAAGDGDGSLRVANEAAALFQELRAAGDLGEGTSLGLALARFTRANSSFAHMNREDLDEAASLLRPIVAGGHASRATKLALADDFNFLSHEESPEKGVADCDEARSILAGIGALEFSDLTASSIYADTSDSEARILQALKKNDEAARLELTVVDMGQKVLAKRPGDLRAMRDIYFGYELLAVLAAANEDLVQSDSYYRKTVDAGLTYTRFNPADTSGWFFYTQSRNYLSRNLFQQGRIGDALEELHQTAGIEAEAGAKGDADDSYFSCLAFNATVEARLGHAKEAEALYSRTADADIKFQKATGSAKDFGPVLDATVADVKNTLLANEGDYASVYSNSVEWREKLKRVTNKAHLLENLESEVARDITESQVEADFRTGRVAEAAADAAAAVDHPELDRVNPTKAEHQLERMRVQLGRAQVELGRMVEARATLTRAAAYYRARRARGAEGTDFRLEFASCLLQLARAEADDEAGRAERRNLLDSASGVLFGLSSEAQELLRAKELAQWIAAARAQGGS